MSEGTITIYAEGDRVIIDTPVGKCFITPQVAMEMTVSLSRAARAADPNLDYVQVVLDFIGGAKQEAKKETIQ